MNDRAKAGRGARSAAPAGTTLLKSVCDRLPIGFALFDASFRIAAWNARFATLRGYPRKLVKAGTPLESFVRFDAERGEYDEGAIDVLTRTKLAALKRGRPAIREQLLPDGRCLRIACERVPAGGLLLTCEDVTELKARERQLAERTAALAHTAEAVDAALAQQAATSEILRVISRSPNDVQPVFETIVRSAYELCDGAFTILYRFDGQLVSIAADYHMSPQQSATLRALYPQHIDAMAGHLMTRTIREARAQSLDDVATDSVQSNTPYFRAHPYGSALAVPMLKDGQPIGVIATARQKIQPFSEQEVSLIQTFADQAVIAIENVRLFNETKEALEQQTATAEILRVISESPGDLDPVFRAILRRATELCDAQLGIVFRWDGERFYVVATRGEDADAISRWREAFAAVGRPGPHSGLGRLLVDRQPVHIPDILEEAAYREGDALRMQTAKILRARSFLAVPLLKNDAVIGAVIIYRREVRPFSARQIELVKVFADQAVIAIENVRLFNETKEALERQTATAEILRVISASPTDIQPVLDAVAERAGRLCNAPYANVMLVEGDQLRVMSVYSTESGPRPDQRNFVPLRRAYVNARAVLDRQVIHIPDVVPLIDAEFPDIRRNQEKFGFRAVLVVPLMREGRAVGTIFVWRREAGPFADDQVALLRTFADQAVIAIENVRLFNELETRNSDLTVSLEQQTATAEILRVISNSPTDITPVLDAVAENAARLCEANDVVVMMNEGNVLRAVKSTGPFGERFGAEFAIPITRGSAAGRAVIERTTVQVPDFELETDEEYPVGREHRRIYGNHGAMATPLLRGDAVLGVIAVLRRDVRPFSERQSALLQTFADQAAIAIANVRLFNETKEALEQQTATGEILRVISSSPTDLEPVFDAVAKSVSRLCDAPDVVIVRAESGSMRFAASVGPFGQTFGRELAVPISRGSVAGRAVLERRTVQVDDLAAEPDAEYPDGKALQQRYGHRTMVAAPLLSGDTALGAVAMLRKEVRPFSEKQIALLRTFADQAVIAIQNARLFREIQEKSHQLEVANQHKSAFLANMSHELRTPLNAVIGFSEMLAARYFGDLTEKQAEYVNDIHGSGKHLLSLINDILDLSKIEAGRMELELGEFDLRAALDNALTLVRERAQRGGVTLRLDADAALGSFRGDERKLKQVMLNLLSNAVKFTSRGGAVNVVAKRIDGAAEIAVCDTGAGIAPEDQEAIFEAFRQVGTDVTRKREGTGLGLALTRRFVELHGGTIRVQSTPGKGSTFTVTLPMRHGE